MIYLLRLVACLLLCVSLNSFGAVIWSNYGPEYSVGNGMHDNGYNQISHAGRFHVPTDKNYLLTEVKMTLEDAQYLNSYNSSKLKVNIMSEQNNLPSEIIGSKIFDMSNNHIYPNPITINFQSDSILLSGGGYWVSLEAYAPGSRIGWQVGLGPDNNLANNYYASNQNCSGPGIDNFYCSYSHHGLLKQAASGAFEVHGSPVPLPAGIYLFLSGLVGLVGAKLRGRNANSNSTNIFL